ncbi:MAG: magnesium transporter [Gammaproteobacteria bacterium]|nr:MAG: magnesium transporter [Gammaproteobacteria bacterium]RLA52849.1 MAG: magnesium transporter [Gammaproteobacteria bacterium]
MDRYFFISDDLDDLEKVEKELEDSGISTPQIHVLSRDDASVASHHLHEVHDFMKTDVVRAALWGAAFGVLASLSVLGFAYYSDVTNTVGWLPFIFLAILILGFCTWEGSFFGFQVPNARFRRFERDLEEGRHLFFIDVTPAQLPILHGVLGHHQRLKPAGHGSSSPNWVVGWQDRFKRFAHWAP